MAAPRWHRNRQRTWPTGPRAGCGAGRLLRERMTLLKFEDQIVRFLKNPREPHLNFPPLSSYHRLIVHRLAQRCGLEHQTADYNPYENSSARVVTLFKTPQSAVPRVLLIDLSADRQTPTVTPASAPRIMMRKRSAPRPGANGGRGNGADKATPSLQDRERAYAEARARILAKTMITLLRNQGPLFLRREMTGTEARELTMLGMEVGKPLDPMAAEALAEAEALLLPVETAADRNLGTRTHRRTDQAKTTVLILTSTRDRPNRVPLTQRTGKKAKCCGATASRR